MSDQDSTINMNFNYANGSVDTMDYIFKIHFATSSEAQKNLDLAETLFRGEISKQLTGKQDSNIDMQFYIEGNSIVIDVKVSRDLISSIHLVAGTKQTMSISEAKSSIESQISGITCAIK